jgi:hypothetical protein
MDHVVEVSSVGFVFKMAGVVGVNRLPRPVVVSIRHVLRATTQVHGACTTV